MSRLPVASGNCTSERRACASPATNYSTVPYERSTTVTSSTARVPPAVPEGGGARAAANPECGGRRAPSLVCDVIGARAGAHARALSHAWPHRPNCSRARGGSERRAVARLDSTAVSCAAAGNVTCACMCVRRCRQSAVCVYACCLLLCLCLRRRLRLTVACDCCGECGARRNPLISD